MEGLIIAGLEDQDYFYGQAKHMRTKAEYICLLKCFLMLYLEYNMVYYD